MFANRLLSSVAVALAMVTMSSGIACADDTKASVTEYVKLPKFCWYQFSDGQVTGLGPEAQMLNCGVGMNHYCYGLLDLQRSKQAKSLDERRGLLTQARNHTRYTLGYMQREGTMESCSITSHVQATMRDIELQMKIYNIK